jgi:hypothetical protein
MGRLVSVTKSGASQVQLPNGHPYAFGDSVVLSNEEFAVINPASYGSDAVLTDRGAFPLVNYVPSGPQVPSLGALDLINSDTVQVGNPAAPARTNLSRYTNLTDVSAGLTEQVVFVPVFVADGDVLTNVVYKTGATAAGTPTHQFVSLYNASGAKVVSSADGTTTARAAFATVTVPFTAPETVAAGAGGVWYVAIGYTATTTPSLLSHVFTSDTGLLPQFAGLTAKGVDIPQAQKSVGGAYTTTGPSTVAGATGVVASLTAPLVILT